MFYLHGIELAQDGKGTVTPSHIARGKAYISYSPSVKAEVNRNMAFLFDKEFRAFLAEKCAAFPPLSVPNEDGLKRAAVAITVVPAEDGTGAAILLTRRAKSLRSHGGQWALPGGRCEEGELAVAAALRELEEELGLSNGSNAVLGLLDDYPTRS